METTTLNDAEIKLADLLRKAVGKAIDDTLKANGQDPEVWRHDPPMREDIQEIQEKAYQLVFRIAEIRNHPDQFGKW